MPGWARRRGAQGGFTLIEVIIAILLLSTVFIGFAGAIFTVSRATGTNKRVQAIDTAMVAYAGMLRSTDLVTYDPCATAGTGGSDTVAAAYETAANAMMTTSGDPGDAEEWRRPDGMVLDIIGVHSWDPVAKKWLASCAVPDSGAQRIRYEVRLGGTTRSAETVKRYPGPTG